MKLTLILAPVLTLFSTFAIAEDHVDCSEKLSKGFSQDSANYHVYADLGAEHSTDVQALILANRALEKAGCLRGSAEVNKIRCKKIVPEEDHTEVCYLETDIGYFFVTQDYIDTANVIYNRWD